MEWDTKDVRAFKEKFNLRKGGRQDVIDADTAFQKALAMMLHRQGLETDTLEAIEKEREGQSRRILENLREEADRLAEEARLLVKVEPKDDKDRDVLVEVLIEAADKWIAFEARCISARNEMTLAGPEEGSAKLAENLKKRATGLNQLAAHLKVEAEKRFFFPSSPFKKIIADLDECAKRLAKLISDLDTPETIDLAVTARQLDDSNAELRDLSAAVAREFDNPGDIYNDILKKTYGLEITKGPKIPYKKLAEAFACVPADHIVNSVLKEVVFSNPDNPSGGFYDKSEKRIRIHPQMSTEGTRSYRNPETGLDEPMNAFSMTTLHEIGHAVDAAYGIMDKNKALKGCGGWTEVNPIIYVQSDYEEFEKQVLSDMDGVPTFTKGDMKLVEPFFVEYIAGKIQQDNVIATVPGVFSGMASNRRRIERKPLLEAVEKLRDRAKEWCETDRKTPFEAGVEESIKLLISGESPMLSEKELSETIVQAAGDFGTIDGWLDDQLRFDRQAGLRIIQQACDKFETALKEAIKTVKASPDLLKDYLEDKSPWDRDLSKETIADKPASHRAYKSDSEWWRYDGEARAATLVRAYQWRAPGEWFADTYSISWFKKVEPPQMVPDSVRPYLFGGHVAKPG
jgi:hypothetical protein